MISFLFFIPKNQELTNSLIKTHKLREMLVPPRGLHTHLIFSEEKQRKNPYFNYMQCHSYNFSSSVEWSVFPPRSQGLTSTQWGQRGSTVEEGSSLLRDHFRYTGEVPHTYMLQLSHSHLNTVLHLRSSGTTGQGRS